MTLIETSWPPLHFLHSAVTTAPSVHDLLMIVAQQGTYYTRDEVVEHASQAEVFSGRERQGDMRKLEQDRGHIAGFSSKGKAVDQDNESIRASEISDTGLDEGKERATNISRYTDSLPPATCMQDAATDPPLAPPVIPRAHTQRRTPPGRASAQSPTVSHTTPPAGAPGTEHEPRATQQGTKKKGEMKGKASALRLTHQRKGGGNT